MKTPHISLKNGEFAKTVLMPGDPLRAKFIAENFLEDAVLINNVRGIGGYTGKYEGVPVSVMASGMGSASMGIYSYELFKFFGVENIMRIGSCGAIREDVPVRSLVIASGASYDTNFMHQYNLPGTFSAVADYKLLKTAADLSDKFGFDYRVGSCITSDCFYGDYEDLPDYKNPHKSWAKMGVLATEMEAAALYATASRLGKRALAILTVSDSLVTGEATTAEEREKTFTDMMKLALSVAVEMDK